MLTIPKSEYKWHESTFIDKGLTEKFRKKYEGFSGEIRIGKDGAPTSIIKSIFKDDLSPIVNDWNSVTITLRVLTDGNIFAQTYQCYQPPGLCSSIIITPGFNKPKIEAFLVDFFYLMGYTNLLVSVRTDLQVYREDAHTPEKKEAIGFMTEMGYEPYLEVNNRRTLNNIILYSKTLKACSF